MNNKDSFNNDSNKKTLGDRVGNAVEKVGNKVSESGAEKLGKKIHDAGDKMESHHGKSDRR